MSLRNVAHSRMFRLGCICRDTPVNGRICLGPCLPVKRPVGTVLAHPVPELALRLPVGQPHERERQRELLADAAKIEIDHLRPCAGVDVLLAVRVDLVHRAMRMAKYYRLHIALNRQKPSSLFLEILKKNCLLLQYPQRFGNF